MRCRNLFTLAAGASAVLCVGVCVLWVRSYRTDRPRLSIHRQGVRYNVRVQNGRIALLGPPPPGRADLAARAAAVAGTIRNADVRWVVSATPPNLEPAIRLDSPTAVLYEQFSRADASRARLDALEDPARFAAGHTILAGTFPSELPDDPAPVRQDAREFSYCGLRVRVRSPADPSGSMTVDALAIDPAQLPTIREYWHELLDVPLWTISMWVPLALAAATPLIWAIIRARGAAVARRRLREGLCIACGYDLRSCGNRCSECGTVAGGEGAAVEPLPVEPVAPAARRGKLPVG